MPDVLDPYSILELHPGTPLAQTKAQFRRLAKSVHPDRNGSDAACQERLRQINAAYEFLSDPVRKADYDAFLARRALPESPGQGVMAGRPVANWGGGSSRALPFLVFLTVLACVVVAVVCAMSQQTLGFSDPIPTVAVGEPTGPAFGHADGQSFVAPPGEALPASSGPGPWPASSTPMGGAGTTAVSPSFTPAPPAAPTWPVGETGSFPSR